MNRGFYVCFISKSLSFGSVTYAEVIDKFYTDIDHALDPRANFFYRHAVIENYTNPKNKEPIYSILPASNDIEHKKMFCSFRLAYYDHRLINKKYLYVYENIWNYYYDILEPNFYDPNDKIWGHDFLGKLPFSQKGTKLILF